MNSYESKQEAKRERYLELARKAEKESNSLYEASRKSVEHIPMGQPILVGHHSERGHRRALDRSWNQMGRSVEASKKAEYYRGKAAGVGTSGISSDDPEAIIKLKEKLEKLTTSQALMKSANKIIKRKKGTREEKIKELAAIDGLPEKPEILAKLFEPDSCGRIGFPDYELKNNNANIRRIKQRIEALEKTVDEETTETQRGEVRIVDNVEDNRLQLFFPGKPSYEVRQKLKSSGFRWSRYNGCWQAYRNGRAAACVDLILNEYEKEATA